MKERAARPPDARALRRRRAARLRLLAIAVLVLLLGVLGWKLVHSEPPPSGTTGASPLVSVPVTHAAPDLPMPPADGSEPPPSPRTEPAPPSDVVEEPEPEPVVEPPPRSACLQGRIVVTARPDPSELVDVSADAYCHDMSGKAGLPAPGAIRVDEEGGLRDVMVQVLDVPDSHRTLGGRGLFSRLTVERCRLDPFLMVLRPDEQLQLRNADPVLHSLDIQAVRNPRRYYAFPSPETELDISFPFVEDAIAIDCGVHPWEEAHLFVLDHPYHAVSDATGRVSIDVHDLPDGRYRLRLWHARLGTTELSVEIRDGDGDFLHAW